MEDYVKHRPKKLIFDKDLQKKLRKKAIDKMKLAFLPNDKIIKIILIGSSVKDTFGQYEPPGFRGSLYSDFDFIFFVEDKYTIPNWLEKELDGKPFPDKKLNLAYRIKNFVDDKYDAEVFFIREKTMNNLETQNLGEAAGIPMTKSSKIKKITIYSKNPIKLNPVDALRYE